MIKVIFKTKSDYVRVDVDYYMTRCNFIDSTVAAYSVSSLSFIKPTSTIELHIFDTTKSDIGYFMFDNSAELDKTIAALKDAETTQDVIGSVDKDTLLAFFTEKELNGGVNTIIETNRIITIETNASWNPLIIGG